MNLIATRYALPWTRIKNAPHWMRCTIEARSFQIDGEPDSWAVVDQGLVLAKDNNEFEYEPQPSSRDEAYRARTRFATVAEAYTAAQRHFEP